MIVGISLSENTKLFDKERICLKSYKFNKLSENLENSEIRCYLDAISKLPSCEPF